jgi:hypothetical protein
VLDLAFLMLCVAVLSGSALAVLYVRGARSRPAPKAVPPLHGALGAAGLLALLFALLRGLPPSHMGTGGFAPTAAALLGAAFCLGLAVALLSWRKGRPAGALVGLHASLAIAGFVVLLALVALG